MTETSCPSSRLTVAQAARELNTTPVRILMMLKQNLLSGQEIDGVWQVTRESIAACLGDPDRLTPKIVPHCKNSGCSGCGS